MIKNVDLQCFACLFCSGIFEFCLDFIDSPTKGVIFTTTNTDCAKADRRKIGLLFLQCFAERNQHQIFLEPEGLTSNEIYPNGISTSLPFDVQMQIVRSMQGMENAKIVRPGYAIEYDFFDPRDLKPTLESKFIQGLFFAGQINGTTGYEEAAAQGLLAGLNAARLSADKEGWAPARSQAYLGVPPDGRAHDLPELG